MSIVDSDPLGDLQRKSLNPPLPTAELTIAPVDNGIWMELAGADKRFTVVALSLDGAMMMVERFLRSLGYGQEHEVNFYQ